MSPYELRVIGAAIRWVRISERIVELENNDEGDVADLLDDDRIRAYNDLCDAIHALEAVTV